MARMIRKIALFLLLISFIIVVVSAFGMEFTSYRKVFKEWHEIGGWLFIGLGFVHLYFNRAAIKVLFLKRKKPV